MALYDGFFDASKIIGTHADGSPEYDREYNSADFVKYFANTIGSGVCIHDNPDSFKAEFEEDGRLFLRKGYLFIQGYWAANVPNPDEDPETYKGYEVVLPGNETYAIVAHLNFGQKIINIEVRSVSMAYPDALVLAIVNGSAQSAEDTRYNTDLCGIIDTAGELSSKVDWAINYINTEIEDKLDQIEADIVAQDRKLTAKIAEVQAVADSIIPPPIGTIKFSAAQDVGPEWLQCNGDFVSESQYPELVAALGKLTPSGDKFQLISSGEIDPQISNGVLYGGRMWVYSYSTKKLYGVDLDGMEAVKEITITSNDPRFNDFGNPSNARPIALSISPHTIGSGAKLFLSQITTNSGYLSSSMEYESFSNYFLIFQSEFSDFNMESLTLSPAFTKIESSWISSNEVLVSANAAVPTVVSHSASGIEKYYCAIGQVKRTNEYRKIFLVWDLDSFIARVAGPTSTGPGMVFDEQRVCFSPKTKKQMVSVLSGVSSYYKITSDPDGTFDATGKSSPIKVRNEPLPLTVPGADKVLVSFDKERFPSVSVLGNGAIIAKSGLSLPNSARIFVDGGAYLWGKDIYIIFVGTGIIFSRTLEEGDFGYLDTSSVLGTITQFGYLDYSQDEGTLYLLGQDTTNTVKVAKIVLNTLYDYANDGAWLPMIAADGVPAYIKAKEAEM